MAGGYVSTEKEAAEQLTYAGQAIARASRGRRRQGHGRHQECRGWSTATAAKSVTPPLCLAGGGAPRRSYDACMPSSRCRGWNCRRRRRRLQRGASQSKSFRGSFFYRNEIAYCEEVVRNHSFTAYAFHADTDAAPVGRHRSIPEGFQGRLWRFRESAKFIGSKVEGLSLQLEAARKDILERFDESQQDSFKEQLNLLEETLSKFQKSQGNKKKDAKELDRRRKASWGLVKTRLQKTRKGSTISRLPLLSAEVFAKKSTHEAEAVVSR